MNKNTFHFGRHVFDYFPWYKYDNNSIKLPPVIDENIIQEFNFSFFGDINNRITFRWCLNKIKYGSDETCLNSVINSNDSLITIIEDKASYLSIEETVNTWEEIEKIRLRCQLGTKEKAEKYLKVIDFYHRYKNEISDIIYSELGEDIEIPLINLSYLKNLCEKEICIKLINEDDIYQALKDNNFNKCKFTYSLKDYYLKNGYLTSKQIDAFKDISYNEILDKKDMIFFSIKVNRLKNINRVTDFLTEIGLSYIGNQSYVLAYKLN